MLIFVEIMSILVKKGDKSMDKAYVTELKIINVRHLHNIRISLSKTERKHLIITGQNGSGKTSLLHSISCFLDYLVSDEYQKDESCKQVAELKDELREMDESNRTERKKLLQKIRDAEMNARDRWNDGCVIETNDPEELRSRYKKGQFILAHCRDDRRFEFNICTDLSREDLKQVFKIDEHPSENIGKYLANLKSALAFAMMDKDETRIQQIETWFDLLRQALCNIYNRNDLSLDFDRETFRFFINIPGRVPIPLEHMSMGYAAMFDIIANLVMRMANHCTYNLEGIVLIDEVENHLHVSLQQKVMPILMELFPNIQFIVTSHSPFVLNSTPNAIVYDLAYDPAHCERTEDGALTDLPYDLVVEQHFGEKQISRRLRKMLDEYKAEVTKTHPDKYNIEILERQLSSVPAHLSLEFLAEYEQAKLDARRNKVNWK